MRKWKRNVFLSVDHYPVLLLPADVEMVLAAVSAAMTATVDHHALLLCCCGRFPEITAVDADPYVITDFNKLRLGRVKHP